jgi:uncharacterized RDD family membrane protein YckC
MDIWIIRDGEKSGPFHDYEIRRRIGLGELTADSPAWHEGLAEWSTLSEIALFRDEFTKSTETEPAPEPEATPEIPPITPPPVPGPPRIIRRFMARWFDISLYIGLWWFSFWLAGRDIEALLINPFVGVTQLVPWFVVEVMLIHYFATTPGKWLLGIRVFNSDGSRLSLAQSTRRALRAYVVGIGLGVPYVMLFCMGLSAYTANKIGATVWDHLGGHRIVAGRQAVWKITLLVVIFIGSLILRFGVISPHITKFMIQSLDKPESKPMREYLETYPFWSLPRRH